LGNKLGTNYTKFRIQSEGIEKQFNNLLVLMSYPIVCFLVN